MTKAFINYQDERSFASKLRKKRMQKLLLLIEKLSTERHHDTLRILDVGGTHLYWKMVPEAFLERMNIEIVLLNLTRQNLPSDAKRFSSIAGDACDLTGLADNTFDLVHSNSVIEHVGTWRNMRRMASEMSRVGRALYVQTPYFWFPIEPHFLMPMLHWLPMSLRCKLAMRMAMGNWPRAQSMNEAMEAQHSAVLLDKRMFQELFPGCTVSFERLAGFPKSLIATRIC